MEPVFLARFPLPFWPFEPWFVGMGLLTLAGLVFSLVMLIDCLKREPRDYPLKFSRKGETERIIWAIGIIVTATSYYFLGAILYFFVVKNEKPEGGGD